MYFPAIIEGMNYFLQITDVTNSAGTYLEKLKDMAFGFAPKIIAAILLYIVGAWLIKMLTSALKRVMTTKQYDPSLQSFLISFVRISLLILLLLAVAGQLGVNITSFAALLAGAGLAIGAALNGSLGNLAGGVMILVFKPFKVGDFIEAQGQTGQVTEMGIFSTGILSPENKLVYIPNGALSTGVISNYTASGYLRVDLTMAIAVNQPIEKARQIAIEAIQTHAKVLPSPAPEVHVNKVGDGMITLAIRPYTKQPDYWDVYFGVQELIKNAWDTAGVDGPVPTRIILNK